MKPVERMSNKLRSSSASITKADSYPMKRREPSDNYVHHWLEVRQIVLIVPIDSELVLGINLLLLLLFLIIVARAS